MTILGPIFVPEWAIIAGQANTCGSCDLLVACPSAGSGQGRSAELSTGVTGQFRYRLGAVSENMYQFGLGGAVDSVTFTVLAQTPGMIPATGACR